MADNAGKIDSLSIEIGASSKQAVADIEKVVGALKKLKTAEADAKRQVSGGGIGKELKAGAVDAMSTLDLMKLKLSALKAEFSKKIMTGQLDTKGFSEYALKVKKLQEEINRKTPKVQYDGNTSAAHLAGLAFKDMAKSIKDASKNLGVFKTLLHGTVSVAKGLANAIMSVVKSVAKIGFGIVKGAINGITSAVKTLGKLVTEVAKKIPGLMANLLGLKGIAKTIASLKQAVNGLARIAVYRLARSAIKAVTEAFKEGSERAYYYAKQYGVATKYIADALDGISSGSFKMSNQLGAAWASLLAAIQPILIQIINLVTAAAEAITRLFALFGGAGTYLKAKDYTHNWADETEKGAKAAKEWKNQLLGFDEINRLTEPSNSSGGSSDLYKDYQNMFEEAKIEGDFYDQIKKAIEDKDWAGLGKLFGQKFNEIIDNADFKGFGKKIGEKLNAAITTSYSFLKEADFKKLGSKIAEMLDNLGDQINFNTLGRLVTRVRTAIWDVLYGAFTNPGSMAKLATNLSNYVLGVFEEMTDWLKGLDPVEVANAIRDFFGNIKYTEIRDKFKELIKTAWSKAIELKNEIWNDDTRAKVENAIKTFLDDVKWRDIKDKIVEKFDWAWGKAVELWDKLGLADKIKTFIVDAINSVDWASVKNIALYNLDKAILGEERANRKWYDKGEFAGREMIDGVKNYVINADYGNLDSYIVDPVAQSIYEAEQAARDGGAGVMSGFADGVTTGGPSAKTKTSRALENNITKPTESAMTRFLTNVLGVKKGYCLEVDQINKATDDVRSTTVKQYDSMSREVPNSMTSMSKQLDSTWNSVTKTTDTSCQQVGKASNTMSNTLKTDATQTSLSVTTTANSMRTNLSSIWSAINAAASVAWAGIRSSASTAWASISGAASSAWASMLSSASSAAASLVSIASSMAQSISSAMGQIKDWLNDAIDYAFDAGRSLASALDGVLDTAGEIADRVSEAARNAYNSARDTASNVYTNVATTVSNTVSNTLNKIKSGARKLGFATGGFPEDGLFFANHTELVGRFDNGRTAVANNEMITAGIAEAAYDAFMRAMADSAGSDDGTPVNIYLDGKIIARSTTKYQRQFALAAG